jgi:hypothetical protein
MFKWSCLGAAAVGLAVVLWMLNDVRLETQRAVRTINDNLPEIVAKTKTGTDVVATHLPEIVDKTRKTTTTLAELAEDVRQLKDLAGLSATVRDQGLVAYADSVLEFLENAPIKIGTKKLVGKGLSDPTPAKDWCVAARKKAVLLMTISRSKQDFLTRLGDKVLGTQWYVQEGAGEPMLLVDWLRAHHPDSKP